MPGRLVYVKGLQSGASASVLLCWTSSRALAWVGALAISEEPPDLLGTLGAGVGRKEWGGSGLSRKKPPYGGFEIKGERGRPGSQSTME